MAARHTIWKWAGIADDWWGRLKVLAFVFGLVTTALLGLWLLFIRDLGVVGIAVLVAAVLFGGFTVLLALEIWWPETPAPAVLISEPQIAIYLPDEPCTRHPLEEVGRSLGRDAVYCHLAVKSLTGANVRGCRATLRDVAKAESGEYVEDQRFTRPLRLKWAHFMPDDPAAEATDIDAEKPSLLDIVCADEATPGIASIVTLDTDPIGIPKAFGPGVYRLTVRVTPEEGPSADLTLLLMVLDATAFGVTLSPYLGEPPPIKPANALPHGDPVATTATVYTGGTIPYPAAALAGATGAPTALTGLRDFTPVGQSAAEREFPVVFQATRLGQDDESDERNSRLFVHVRAINRGDEPVSLIFTLGIFLPESEGALLWQQAREPGAHPLSVLTGTANAAPSEVSPKRHADLTLEFMIAKDYIDRVREKPLRHEGREIPNIVGMESLRLRVKDLISGASVEKQLPLDEA